MPVGIQSILIKSLVLLTAIILTACASTPTPTPTATPTVINRLIPKSNENAQVLESAQAALSEFRFGFAPLLQLEDTRLVIERGPSGEYVRLAYPPQPADPSEWPSVDSFVLVYAVRSLLSTSPQVRQVLVGKFEVAVPSDDLPNSITHYAAWVRFLDGSEAVVDLSPLATNFAARHRASEFITDAETIESQFKAARNGVPLDVFQPMKVVTQGNAVYYLMANVLVLPDRYKFSLAVYLTQTATPIQSLQLTRGSTATIEISRSEFETVRQSLLEAGPTVFSDRPELLSRSGHDDPNLQAVLTKNLPLLWDMVTKLEHQAGQPVGTPQPTFTPTSTPSPTPTRTPTPLPLQIS